MSVWGMAADSILQCFCVDKELNGKGKLNVYCPAQLLEFVQDSRYADKIDKQVAKKKAAQDNYAQRQREDPEYGKPRKCCCC